MEDLAEERHAVERPVERLEVEPRFDRRHANDGDPLPMDVARISPSAFVGEVVMRAETTAFLAAAAARGCRVQVGTDMLFEQIPAYLEFFGYPTTTPEMLRSLARIRY